MTSGWTLGKASMLMGLLCVTAGIATAVEAAPGVTLASRIVVHKRAHVMEVYGDDRLLRRLRVSLGSGGLGPEGRRGGRLVPEGAYVIDGANPYSGYHLSLHISYPTRAQVRVAAARGVRPGGAVMIHGLPNGVAMKRSADGYGDWTDGCIALSDAEIEWLWDRVPNATPILILP